MLKRKRAEKRYERKLKRELERELERKLKKELKREFEKGGELEEPCPGGACLNMPKFAETQHSPELRAEGEACLAWRRNLVLHHTGTRDH